MTPNKKLKQRNGVRNHFKKTKLKSVIGTDIKLIFK